MQNIPETVITLLTDYISQNNNNIPLNSIDLVKFIEDKQPESANVYPLLSQVLKDYVIVKIVNEKYEDDVNYLCRFEENEYEEMIFKRHNEYNYLLCPRSTTLRIMIVAMDISCRSRLTTNSISLFKLDSETYCARYMINLGQCDPQRELIFPNTKITAIVLSE